MRGVFDSVAPRYDLMNDLMSLGPAPRLEGLHGGGGQRAARATQVLDIAGGTGDLALAFAQQGRRDAAWWCTPTSTRPCCAPAATACSTTAWSLPTVGLRRREAALRRRQLRPGQRRLRPAQHDAQGPGAGRDEPRAASRAASCWCWSSPRSPQPLAKAYDWYSFKVLPRLGQLVAGDADELPLPGRVDPHASRTRKSSRP